MGESPVRDKSYAFAIRIVKLYRYLTEEKREFVMSRQLLDSGTAIGAFVKEAQQAESRADFRHEMNVALKKASRCEYWLQLLSATEYLEEREFASISKDCTELLALLTAIVKTTKGK